MKESWSEIFESVIKSEGGFVDHPSDPGGMTNLGVTRAVYSRWLGRETTETEMRNLTKEDVSPIYKQWYFDAINGDDLPSGIDYSVCDIAINSGPNRAAKMLQKCVGAQPDGAIGPMTLQAVSDSDSAEVVERLADVRQSFYEGLKTFETFGKGWTRRNKEVREHSLEMINGPAKKAKKR
jgi:lysozyme family protein